MYCGPRLSLLSNTRNSALWRPTCKQPIIFFHVEENGGVHESTVLSFAQDPFSSSRPYSSFHLDGDIVKFGHAGW
ncbi:hypothetical protein VNO77_20576 [Canavalia gladiata]|uniref:Uncharacterized protein n=1 Tax=Canavalia gladiata TaxID=3824 RepID=A0AAN9QJH1_CANGL